jgi:hypothetical protein
MKKAPQVVWLSAVEKGNFIAAESYLSLLMEPKLVRKILKALRSARPSRFKAKDIFRASELSLLGISNANVEQDRKRIRRGIALSPILLVRGGMQGRVIVADGYHRLCAVYGFDEDAWIPCGIV